MLRQRRRWLAGSREDNSILSLDRILMYGIRDLSWSVTGVIPVLVAASFLSGIDIVFANLYRIISLSLLVFMYVWIVIGVMRYRPTARTVVAVVVLAPLTTVLHSIGALWGMVLPPETFDVTAKVDGDRRSDESESGRPDRTLDIDQP